MSGKPMMFQPAPRPQPRVSPEQTRELAEATRDLGFGRTTSAPDVETPSEIPKITTEAPAEAPPVRSVARAEPAAPLAGERLANLKVAMPEETWDALRHEALNRRVTVKFLVMEALAEKGYAVDLSKIAEDGRRLR